MLSDTTQNLPREAPETTASRIQTLVRNRAIAIVLLIIICAGAVRLLTYDRYLPYVDYSDESVYVALADEIRGFSDQSALREKYGSLAPLYVYINAAVQGLSDLLRNPPWHVLTDYFYAMRLLSVIFGIGTALAIAWIGWQLGGWASALVGGMIWALSPIVVDLNSLAIPDPLLYLVCTLAVATAIAAWQKQSYKFLFLSLMFGIAAIYIKLWLATAVIPFMLASVLMLRRNPAQALKRIALIYGVAALFALHFLVVANPFANTWKIRTNLEDGAFVSNLFSIQRILNNLWHLVYPVDAGLGLSFLVLIAGGIAVYYCRRKGLKTAEKESLWIIGVYLLTTLWLSAGISNVNIDSNGRMRHILPASVAFIPLWSFCLIQLITAVNHWLAQRTPNRKWLASAGAGVVMLAVLFGFVWQDFQLVAVYSHPHAINALINWFDGSPPRDGIVLLPSASSHNALWNRWWGAYAGSKPYEFLLMPGNDIPSSSPASYAARDIRWLVLSDDDMERTNDTQRLNSFLDQLLLTKTIVATPGQVEGRNLYVYRFEPPMQQADADFSGEIRFVGYDLSTTALSPGETLRFRPYWRLEHPIQQNLSMFAHIYPAGTTDGSVLVAQWDGEPITNGNRPTSLWNDTSEVYFGEPFALSVPADTPPGNYVLALGLYDYATHEHLTLPDGSTFFSIPFTVTGVSS